MSKQSLGLWDVVFMNVAAIVGLRWIPIAAGYGASSISYWTLAALLFFIPIGLISADLAMAFPEDGGLSGWIKRAFGKSWGFLSAWFYWLNNLFFYPSLLTFVAVTMATLINPALVNNKGYVCLTILITFWGITFINLFGLSMGKWLANLGATFGTLIPGLLLVGLGVFAAFHHPIPTDYSLSQWMPRLNGGTNWAFLSVLMFGMAGIEVTSVMGKHIQNAQKNLPRSIWISGICIVALYLLGTVSMTLIASPTQLTAANGLMDAFSLAGKQLGLAWVVPVTAILLSVGCLGGTSVWAVAPLEMLENTQPDLLPQWMTKRNRHGAPQNALILQAILVSAIVLITTTLPSVAVIYQMLVSMTTLTYFVPYLAMGAGYLVLLKRYPDVERPCRIPGPRWMSTVIASLCLISVGMAIAFSLIPPPNLHGRDATIYLLEIISGPVVLGGIGMLLALRPLPRKAVEKTLPLALVLLFLGATPAKANDWTDGLTESQISAVRQGEIVIRLRSTPKASMKNVEAVGYVNAPVDEVWKLITDYNRYSHIYSGVRQSEIRHSTGATRQLYLLLDYPWPFQDKWVLCDAVQEPQNWTIDLHRVDGSVKEVEGGWYLYPNGNRTLVVYSIRFDPGLGFIPPWLIEWGSTQAAPIIIKGLRQALNS